MNSYKCQICGRKLTDNESIALGVGPDCAAKRTSFVASCGTSEAEIAALENASGEAARWIRNFRQDMRAGRVRQARQCIEIARHKAEQSEPVVTPLVAPAVVASEPPQPAIVVRSSERGYRVHPPYKHPQFVAAFKRTVSGRWYPEASEWFIPATCLQWAIELLQYWFLMPVYVEGHAENT
ncbi:MAG: hypothetical protein JNK38_14505 [Acidobacteria bacterium]|nr:hypothetical protein [Acidobacteriota bacterium]